MATDTFPATVATMPKPTRQRTYGWTDLGRLWNQLKGGVMGATGQPTPPVPPPRPIENTGLARVAGLNQQRVLGQIGPEQMEYPKVTQQIAGGLGQGFGLPIPTKAPGKPSDAPADPQWATRMQRPEIPPPNMAPTPPPIQTAAATTESPMSPGSPVTLRDLTERRRQMALYGMGGDAPEGLLERERFAAPPHSTNPEYAQTLSQIRQRQSGDLNVSRPFGNRETRAVSTPYSGGVSLNMGGPGAAAILSPPDTRPRPQDSPLWGRTLQGDIGTQQVADVTDLPEEDLQVARNMGLRSMMERRQQRESLPQVQATRTARAERDQEAMAMRQQRAQEAQDVRNFRIRGPLASIMAGGGEDADKFEQMLTYQAMTKPMAARTLSELRQEKARSQGLPELRAAEARHFDAQTGAIERFDPTTPIPGSPEHTASIQAAQGVYDQAIKSGMNHLQAEQHTQSSGFPNFRAPLTPQQRDPRLYGGQAAAGSPTGEYRGDDITFTQAPEDRVSWQNWWNPWRVAGALGQETGRLRGGLPESSRGVASRDLPEYGSDLALQDMVTRGVITPEEAATLRGQRAHRNRR